MVVYQGKRKAEDFIYLLDEIFKKQGFTEVSTEKTTDGYVYKSSDTEDNLFYIRVKNDVSISRLVSIGVYETYTPGESNGLPGTFSEGSVMHSCIIWATSSLTGLEVDYVITANNKSFVIFVEGPRAFSGSINSLTYVGMPSKLDGKDLSGTFAGVLYTANGAVNNPNTFYSLRNRAEVKQSPYILDYYNVRRSYGWGEKLFSSQILVGARTEGARGLLTGIHTIEKLNRNYEAEHKNEMMMNGKKVKIIIPSQYGNTTLSPSNTDYLIEI